MTVHVYSHVLWLALVYFPKCVPLGPVTSLIVWQGQQWSPVFSYSYLHVSFPSFTKQYPRESSTATFFLSLYILNAPTLCVCVSGRGEGGVAKRHQLGNLE